MTGQAQAPAKRVVIVTGAAGGIGRATVDLLNAEGNTVVAMDRDESALSVYDGAPRVHSVVLDVSDPAAVEAAVAQVADTVGPPSALVAAAGVNSRTAFLDLAVEEWDRVMNVNLRGVFLVGQCVARAMRDAKIRGSIVNVASIAARVVRREDISVYAASKAGVEALTRAMAASLGRYGIRVNAVAPGPIETEMTMARRTTGAGTQELLRGVIKRRLGLPIDVAYAIRFLLDSESDFTTGTTLAIDGGILVGTNVVVEAVS